jgi:hypothetical protein
MSVTIKNRYTGAVMHTVEGTDDLGEAVKRLAAQSANLESANLESANLKSANLESANLESANLKSANLEYANLKSANLESANLESANLKYANLKYANLESANLKYANLKSANLESANLESANLESANLKYANLESANLKYANLKSANLESANLKYANLKSANLESAKGIPIADPALPRRVAEAILAKPDALNMATWHGSNACGTTHCLAGWAIALTPGASMLEDRIGAQTTGQLLMPSAAHLFTATNQAALEWCRSIVQAAEQVLGVELPEHEQAEPGREVA